MLHFTMPAVGGDDSVPLPSWFVASFPDTASTRNVPSHAGSCESSRPWRQKARLPPIKKRLVFPTRLSAWSNCDSGYADCMSRGRPPRKARGTCRDINGHDSASPPDFRAGGTSACEDSRPGPFLSVIHVRVCRRFLTPPPLASHQLELKNSPPRVAESRCPLLNRPARQHPRIPACLASETLCQTRSPASFPRARR